MCRSLAVSQSAEEATEAIEVSEEAGPNENADNTLGPFTEHVFTDNTHRYLNYSLLNHKNLMKVLTKCFHKGLCTNIIQFSKPVLFFSLQKDGFLFAEYVRK